MTFRPILRLAARALLVALAVSSVSVGCSRQGEGERCDLEAAGNDDCDSGLVCTSCRRLADHQTDRCCPPSGGTGRCELSPSEDNCVNEVVGSGGSAGSTGSGGSGAGTAGASSGGAGNGGGGTGGDDDPAGAGGA